MLTILWFLMTARYFFELDLLRAMPGNYYLQSNGRGRKPTNLEANMTFSTIDNDGHIPLNYTEYLILKGGDVEFSYDNNVIDQAFDVFDIVGILYENNKFFGKLKDVDLAKTGLPSKTWERVKESKKNLKLWQDWLIVKC